MRMRAREAEALAAWFRRAAWEAYGHVGGESGDGSAPTASGGGDVRPQQR